MTKRAVLYARVSSDDRGNDGRNLASQLEMCRDYANQRDYQAVAELAEDDRGASGAVWDLPELGKVLDLAQAGMFEVLVVREQDRLARSLGKQLFVEEELRRAGASIEYVLGATHDTPEGDLLKNVRASVAEFERLKIAERTRRGRRNVVKAGCVMLHGNRPPYGYRLSDDGKTLIVHEPEARIIALIFQWYTVGDESGQRLGAGSIAKRLTEMGVPTWADVHGMVEKRRAYGNWAKTGVLDVIHNETYSGTWHYGRSGPRENWLDVEVPPIVDKETWDLAQHQCRRNQIEADRNVKRDYLMRHRLRCGCGHGMNALCISWKRNGQKKPPYFYYRCIGVADYPRTCDAPGFRVDLVDPAIWAWVKDLLLDPGRLAQGLREQRAQRERDNAPLRDRLSVIDGLLADNQGKLERVLDLYVNGDIPKDLLTERKARIEATAQSLGQERERLVAQVETRELTTEQIQTIEDFATQVREKLDTAETKPSLRRHVIELLDVRGTCAIENGQKVLYVSSEITGASDFIGAVGKSIKTVTYQRMTPAASRQIGEVTERQCRVENMLAHGITARVRVERYERL